MKTVLTLFLMLISFTSYSQISLDFQTSVPNLRTIRLSNEVTKYSRDFDTPGSITKFDLYNLDGSLYKTIDLPPKPFDTAEIHYIANITTSLFDNDPTNIEYLIIYYVQNAGFFYSLAQVIREDGTILLNEPYADIYVWPSDFTSSSVFNTEEGAKLRLYYYDNGIEYSKVFSLPGEIPTNINNTINSTGMNPMVYPNPNNGSFSLRLQSIGGEMSTIDLFSPNGKLIKSYKSSENDTHIVTPNLSDGLYFINARSKNKNSSTKFILKN